MGLRSKIIGENSIFKQASQSIQNYLYHNPQNKNYMNILSNAKVTLIPGKFFGESGKSFIRLCFARDPEILKLGLERITKYLL